jgi:hypothetical protein
MTPVNQISSPALAQHQGLWILVPVLTRKLLAGSVLDPDLELAIRDRLDEALHLLVVGRGWQAKLASIVARGISRMR